MSITRQNFRRRPVCRSAVIVCFFLFSGCASHRMVRYGDMSRSADEIIREVNAHSGSIATLHATGDISVESPRVANSASFDLSIRRPDSVRILIQGPFGIRVGSALIVQNQFTFYNALSNQVVRGSVNDESAVDVLNMHIDPNDVVDAFCGTRTFHGEAEVPDSFQVVDGMYTLKFHHEDRWTIFSVDPASMRIVSVQQRDRDGAVKRDEEYAYDQTNDGEWSIQSIHLTHPESRTSISLYYQTVKTNIPLAPLALTVPDDADERSIRR